MEGPLDSLFIDNSLAVAGADFGHLPYDKEQMTIVLDNEPRSKEIIKRMEHLIENNYELVIWPDNIQQKDINDMVLRDPKGDILKIINKYKFSGLTAKLKLANWKRI